MRCIGRLGLIVGCLVMLLPVSEAQAGGGGRMVIENVDRYRVMEPCCEGVRVVLGALGEEHTPAYIQGISGAAFRIAGVCPCAPTSSSGGPWPTALLKRLGYEYTEQYLADDAKDPKLGPNTLAMIAKVKDSIRAGRPVLVWHAFTSVEWDVVAGYDDAEGVFLGRGSYAGLEGYAKAKQDRAREALSICPAFGAIFVGERTGKFDAHAAEIAAVKEAVRHAHDQLNVDKLGGEKWVMLEGLGAYDRWAEKFKDPGAQRELGDAYCFGVYRSTHRAAGQFLRQIAPHFPEADEVLVRAAREFNAEAITLDKAHALLGWDAPAQDPARNQKLWPVLSKARDHYAAGIALLEQALPLMK